MSIHADDLRNHCGYLGELAAQEIEDLERSEEILSGENYKLKLRVEDLEKAATSYSPAALLAERIAGMEAAAVMAESFSNGRVSHEIRKAASDLAAASGQGTS